MTCNNDCSTPCGRQTAKEAVAGLPVEQLLGTASGTATLTSVLETAQLFVQLLNPILATSSADKQSIDKLTSAIANLAAENALLRQHLATLPTQGNSVTIGFGPGSAYRLVLPVTAENRPEIITQLTAALTTVSPPLPVPPAAS